MNPFLCRIGQIVNPVAPPAQPLRIALKNNINDEVKREPQCPREQPEKINHSIRLGYQTHSEVSE